MATQYLTAREAAAELGISLPTLYAYVSRGLVRSETAGGPGHNRQRRYHAEDVRRLKARQEQRRDPAKAVEGALSWGTPVLESAITLVADDTFYYRGHDALALASTHSVEQVAALIWSGDATEQEASLSPTPGTLSPRCRAALPHLEGLPPVEAFQAMLPLAAADDAAAYDLRPGAVPRTGARILRLLAAIAVGEQEAPGGLAAALQRGWAPDVPAAASLLNAALILCADQELNVTSFAARCVASAGATPYAVVLAGLAALSGTKHAGRGARIEAFLREVETPERARAAIASRLKQGESLPGFGHALYPAGDPRGRELLRRTAETCPTAPMVALAGAVAEAAYDVTGERPDVEFGLVTLAGALDLPPGGASALFALSRTIGWIGHAIEEYQADRLIRPRARYVGPPPLVPER